MARIPMNTLEEIKYMLTSIFALQIATFKLSLISSTKLTDAKRLEAEETLRKALELANLMVDSIKFVDVVDVNENENETDL